MEKELTTIHREIKSFVLRQGKITKGQQNALEQYLDDYAITFNKDEQLNFTSLFNRNAPNIIEIGFGMGNATWQIAKNNPQNNYLGIEVHLPGVGSLLNYIAENDVNNLKIIRHDAVEVLKYSVADNSIDGFHIYFPDPWPKKRHHKRRIIQADFIKLLAQKLKPNGYIHLATDWEEYATWMLEILNQEPSIKNASNDNTFIPRPEFRPLTKFENRGINLGHGVWDLMFTKI